MTVQRLPVYLINIARAADRLEEVRSHSIAFGIEVERVHGVDGHLLSPEQWVGADHRLFERRHGRTILPGEYGCYQSHLLALRQFLASSDDAAIIIEDDIALNGEFIDRALSAMDAVPGADMIKLVNHRWKGFRTYARSEHGDRIGRCLFGPQGSTACYLVTRGGAEKILKSLATMSLPWDVAVERGWDMDLSVFASADNFVGFSKLQRSTMIGRRRDYLAAKLSALRRMPAHLFRTVDFVRRIVYALSPLPPLQGAKLVPAEIEALR